MNNPDGTHLVPCSTPLGDGTAEQNPRAWNRPWNGGGTPSLKTLANRVLQGAGKRSSAWNNDGTEEKKPVPQVEQAWNKPVPYSTPLCTGTVEQEALADLYEERAGIYQFDAGYTREEAERWAYRDVVVAYTRRHYPAIHDYLKAITQGGQVQ